MGVTLDCQQGARHAVLTRRRPCRRRRHVCPFLPFASACGLSRMPATSRYCIWSTTASPATFAMPPPDEMLHLDEMPLPNEMPLHQDAPSAREFPALQYFSTILLAEHVAPMPPSCMRTRGPFLFHGIPPPTLVGSFIPPPLTFCEYLDSRARSSAAMSSTRGVCLSSRPLRPQAPMLDVSLLLSQLMYSM